MTEIHLPKIMAADQVQVTDLAAVLLVEFAPAATVREVLEAPDGSGALATGLRLHRVIQCLGPGHWEQLTAYDATLDHTPLAFMIGRPGAVLAAAVPGAQPEDAYTWTLVEVGPLPEDGVGFLPILGLRPATATEETALDDLYPGWRANCQAFDREVASRPVAAPLDPVWATKVEQLRGLLVQRGLRAVEFDDRDAAAVGEEGIGG